MIIVKDFLEGIYDETFIMFVQSQHNSDVDEVCGTGYCGVEYGIHIHNYDLVWNWVIDKFEYLSEIKTLHRWSDNRLRVKDYKEGGYVLYVRPKNEEPKTLFLKGLTFESN